MLAVGGRLSVLQLPTPVYRPSTTAPGQYRENGSGETIAPTSSSSTRSSTSMSCGLTGPSTTTEARWVRPHYVNYPRKGSAQGLLSPTEDRTTGCMVPQACLSTRAGPHALLLSGRHRVPHQETCRGGAIEMPPD